MVCKLDERRRKFDWEKEFKFILIFLLHPWSNTQSYNPIVNILTLDIYFLRSGDLTVLTLWANIKIFGKL